MLDQRYQTFALLAKFKSYTKTAAALYITQPAVSQQIKSLENELNLKLVQYKHPRLDITPAGHQLAVFIKNSQHQEQQLLTRLQNADTNTKLKFGATLSVSVFLVPTLIKKWQAQASDIQCLVSNTNELLQKLDAGELDFTILEGNFDKNNYGSKVINHEEFVAVTASNNPLLNQGPITLDDLLDEPLILREQGSGTRQIFTRWASAFNTYPSDFKQVIELGSAAAIINLVKKMGVSFMYRALVEDDIKAGALSVIDLQGFEINRPISLVYAKDSFFEDEYLHLFE